MNIKLPEPTLRRLPWYLAYVKLVQGKGAEYISSTQISKAINVDSSQIAKDLSFINISGKTRVGYEVASLVDVLEDFLGFISVVSIFAVSLYAVSSWGTYIVILIAICAYILYLGVHISRKLMNKEDER